MIDKIILYSGSLKRKGSLLLNLQARKLVACGKPFWCTGERVADVFLLSNLKFKSLK